MEPWRKNLYSLWSAQFIAMIGLSMVVPFLPLYLREIGVKGDEAVKIWSGLIFSAPFMVGAFLQPVWGLLGDRYGRKPMIVRAMMGLSLANFLMGFAQTAPQLLALRFFQGSLAGFVAPSLALMASHTPENRMGQALGTLQSALVTGMIVGPLIGGFLTHLFGYRLIFFGTALSCFVAALVVLKMVQEKFEAKKRKQPVRLKENLSYVFHSPTLRAMILLFILVQLSLQIATPFMSLYVEHLGVRPDYIGLMTGLVFGITGVTNALSAPVWGKRGDRIGYAKILSFSLLGMTLASLPQAIVTNVYQLLALRGTLGIFAAGVIPTVNTLVQRSTDEHRRGGIYGIFQSGLLVGNVFGPLVGGMLAAYLGLRMILLVNGSIMGLAFLWLRKTRPHPLRPSFGPVIPKNRQLIRIFNQALLGHALYRGMLDAGRHKAGEVLRLQLEDLCQALGVLPDPKYENEYFLYSCFQTPPNNASKTFGPESGWMRPHNLDSTNGAPEDNRGNLVSENTQISTFLQRFQLGNLVWPLIWMGVIFS